MTQRATLSQLLVALPSIHRTTLTLLSATTLTLFYNDALWSLILKTPFDNVLDQLLFDGSFFLFIFLIFNILLTLISVSYIQKPIIVLIILSATGCNFFASHYGIMFDRSMMQNLMETDSAEVVELVNFHFLINLLFFGAIPATLITLIRIKPTSISTGLKHKLINILLSVLLLTAVILLAYKDFSSVFRTHREIRNLIIPTSYLYYGSRYLSGAYDLNSRSLQTIGLDASSGPLLNSATKKVVTVVVVGETARAMNFSLNHYGRETNPELSKENIINFSQTYSCGTNTAVSVPCMFSDIPRNKFDNATAQSRENVLDVLSHAGINVLWRDNNSGCKGVCERIHQQNQKEYRLEADCNAGECFDEMMLNNLSLYLNNTDENTMIVLHQHGSHGPSYAHRYPKKYEQFTPVCEGSDLQSCSQQQVINAYDNTILYTDHFLAKVINFLKQHNDQYITAMLYVSDHGESLGESNLYLHGLPYFIAPEEQTHVPLILWLSEAYKAQFNINNECLSKQASSKLSHDNLFHSILGFMDIQTTSKNKALDIFSKCRNVQKIAGR
jgi:lipid A ethanolaminephosphotransferase